MDAVLRTFGVGNSFPVRVWGFLLTAVGGMETKLLDGPAGEEYESLGEDDRLEFSWSDLGESWRTGCSGSRRLGGNLRSIEQLL